MASVNKQSIREEVEKIKSDFEILSKSKKLNTESKILFQSMLMLINLLVAIFLEKTTKKNNKNSSLPSSQTEKDTSSTQKTNAKGKEESNLLAQNTRTVETVSLAKVTECDICGADLRKADCDHIERRTKIDIVFEKMIQHVDAEVKHCEECDATVKGIFPSDMQGPLQYGNGIKAYVINLVICQMISLNRIQKMVKTIMGEMLSESTLLKFVFRFYELLASWEEKAKSELLKSTCMNVDETSLRVSKKNYWIHSYSSGEVTLKYLHSKRGKEAINEIDMIPKYGGTIIHDGWSSYFAYEHCEHGLCGSHIVRELKYVIDSNEYQWAKDMKKLLLEQCKKISKCTEKKLSEKEYKKLEKVYDKIIEFAEKEMPAIPDRTNGKRGKIAKTVAHNLCERLKKHKSSVLLFAQKSEVPFTNNRAERDLRMTKVKQKVSGCFRTEMYAKAYCRISSYLQTMANKGYNPLVAIQMILSGEDI